RMDKYMQLFDKKGLKLYKEDCNSSSYVDNATHSIKALTASYAISNLSVKNSKPFCKKKFVKECIIAAVESFGNSLTLEEAASIPLSDKTVKSRIDDIASSLENKLKSLLASCSFFSLCLDESTDNRHVSQLSIFVRIVDFSYVEELLDFVSLHDTTGIDIFEAVKTLQKFGIDFSKCSAIVTDGAKVMTGLKNGFFSLVSHIDFFRRKLILFKHQLENDVFHFFPFCHSLASGAVFCQTAETYLYSHIIESLINQFDMRFSDFETLRQDLTLFENPLIVQIEEQSLEFQAELCDLQCDFSFKTRLEKGIEFFKILNASCYPRLRKFGLRIFSMFGSTYLCECSFSKMKFTKTEKRSSLNDASLSSIMRTTSSKISVDIPSLIESCKRPKRSN
ncbi:GT2D2 protein, partial [Acromyrmex heyeri]